MKLTEEILVAMNKAIDDAGSQVEFAQKCHLSKQHINKYVHREIKRVEDDTWAKLEPVLRPYLPKMNATPAVGVVPGVGMVDLPLTDDDRAILEFFRAPENRKERLKLLLAIEEWKHPTPQGERLA